MNHPTLNWGMQGVNRSRGWSVTFRPQFAWLGESFAAGKTLPQRPLRRRSPSTIPIASLKRPNVVHETTDGLRIPEGFPRPSPYLLVVLLPRRCKATGSEARGAKEGGGGFAKAVDIPLNAFAMVSTREVLGMEGRSVDKRLGVLWRGDKFLLLLYLLTRSILSLIGCIFCTVRTVYLLRPHHVI